MLKAYFDRTGTSIDGFFTLQEIDNATYGIKAAFKRILARSGQRGYPNSSWVRGKSPIPYGKHKLSLESINQGALPGTKGVGEFFPIHTDKYQDSRQIVHPGNPDVFRQDIGLHGENSLPGSAGCIVIVDIEQFKTIAAYLKAYASRNVGINDIDIEVL